MYKIEKFNINGNHILIIFIITVVSVWSIPVSAEMTSCSNNFPTIKYDIQSGKIISCAVDRQGGSLVLSFETHSNGTIAVKIPRNIIDAKSDTCEDKGFFVLVNGAEVNFEEKRLMFSRILTIPIESDDVQLEIISSAQYTNYYHLLKCSPKDPPKQQISYGTLPEDVSCNYDLVPIEKISDSSIACVKSDSTGFLIKRGWGQSFYNDGSFELNSDNGIHATINYKIRHGVITDIKKNTDTNSLIIELTPTGKGKIVVELPRNAVDGKNGTDAEFFVLVGGEEVNFEEKTNEFFRELSIPFLDNSKQIEIISPMHQ